MINTKARASMTCIGILLLIASGILFFNTNSDYCIDNAGIDCTISCDGEHGFILKSHTDVAG